MTYFSDGCAAQYKNKKAISNVWFHERDFGIPAEWHFYATSHGKGACDGVGGMVKHTVMLHCLRVTKPGEQITTARALYKWVKHNIKGVKALWVPQSSVLEEEAILAVRFQTVLDIEGIQSHHAFIPKYPVPHVMMKAFSFSESFVLKKISTREFKLNFTDVQGFIIFSCNQVQWQLGNITDGRENEEMFSVLMFEPIENKPLSYHFTDSVIDVQLDDIICLVNPYFQNKGQIVKLRVADVRAAEVKFNKSNAE